MDKHQELMDKAYSRWQKGGDLHNTSRIEFLDKLTDPERMAVVLGNLNYQVENGGWNQWVDNGYCTSIVHLKDALEKVGTPTAKKVLTMVETVEDDLSDEVVSGNCTDGGCFGRYYKENRHGEQEEDCWHCRGEGVITEWDDDEENDVEVTCEECGGDGMTVEWMDAPDYSELDNKFYEINEHFMKECEELLSKES